MVTSFSFLFIGVGVCNMHTALGNKLKEVEFRKLDGWDFNEKQLAFIEAVLNDDLAHQTNHLQNFNKRSPETSSKE